MYIDSSTPGQSWTIYFASMSNPRCIAATECNVETLPGGIIQTTSGWDSRHAKAVFYGRATAKLKNTAYAALLDSMLARGYITQAAFDSAPKVFS